MTGVLILAGAALFFVGFFAGGYCGYLNGAEEHGYRYMVVERRLHSPQVSFTETSDSRHDGLVSARDCANGCDFCEHGVWHE